MAKGDDVLKQITHRVYGRHTRMLKRMKKDDGSEAESLRRSIEERYERKFGSK